MPANPAAGAPWKKVAEAIVNIFETGSALGNYSAVTLIPHDSGHLTYGRSQASLGSGNLYLLVDEYCLTPGATFTRQLAPYLPRLQARETALDIDIRLKNLLRASADNPVMRDAQDAFFDRHYWQSAASEAATSGIRSPLGIATVYDSMVHGSWQAMRDRTNSEYGTLAALGEHAWIKAYLATRRTWLATNPRPDLRMTVYRMDALLDLASHEAWQLDMPLVVRGVEISELTLAGDPPGCYSGPAAGSRELSVQSPLLRGADVRLLQLDIGTPALPLVADGIYGTGTIDAFRIYQKLKGMPQTGIASPGFLRSLAQTYA
jgi:chitosanase